MKHYLVQDSKRGKVFKTLKEASGYSNLFFKKTGEMVAVVETGRKVTHTFNI